MAEDKPDSSNIEKGTGVGVPGGPKLRRTDAKIDSPLTTEETAKYASLIGPADGVTETPPPRGTPLALIIDDDPDARFFEARALAKFDFACIECEDGKAGLKKVLSDKPDLILVDLKMPGMDGFEVIRGVRTYLKFKKVMIIVLSSLGTVMNEVTALSLGADDFLVKPVNREKLTAKMESIRRRVGIDKT